MTTRCMADDVRGGRRPGRAAGTFVVTVESSAVRNLIGQRVTRVFKVSGDRLVLTPADPAEGWRVTYRRF